MASLGATTLIQHDIRFNRTRHRNQVEGLRPWHDQTQVNSLLGDPNGPLRD
jgi:hypothetical protein